MKMLKGFVLAFVFGIVLFSSSSQNLPKPDIQKALVNMSYDESEEEIEITPYTIESDDSEEIINDDEQTFG